MSGVTLNMSLAIDASLSGTGDFPGRVGIPVRKTFSMAPGTASVDESDLLFADDRALTASTSENLDLAGVLTSPLGTTVTAAEITMLYFEALTNGIVIGNVTNGFVGPLGATGTLTLQEGEFVALTSRSGWTVTAATGDLVKVAPTGVTASYRVIIVGRSVAR